MGLQTGLQQTLIMVKKSRHNLNPNAKNQEGCFL